MTDNPFLDEMLAKAVIAQTPAPAVRGLYFLILERAVTYVGYSNNINVRMGQHLRDVRFGRKPKFTHYSAVECRGTPDEIRTVELECIRALCPPWNKDYQGIGLPQP